MNIKWVCSRCPMKDGTAPCTLIVEDEIYEQPYWCPWSLNPMSDGEEAEWEEIKSSEGATITPLKYDSVSNPSHYTEGREHEPIEVIEDWKLGFCLGNAVKYISRAGRKNDAIEDLEKAVWYLQHEIENLRKRWNEKDI